MKKALSISIAQTLFTIEEDAYQKLDTYLRSVRNHFAKTEGGQDIILDIEARIAELFLASKKQIITLVEVESVIASMGLVEDFDDQHAKESGTREEKEGPVNGQKRLFRDTDNGIVAGVSAGLAAYVGIDPLWIRVAFIILTLTSGIGIPVYIVLWLAMPEAKTAAQKLEMQGSPVTIENLTENLKEKMSTVAKQPGNIIRRFVEGIVAVVGSVVQAIVSVIGPLMRWIVGLGLLLGSLFGIIMLSIGVAVFISGSYIEYVDFPLQHVLSQTALYLGALGAYLLLLIPAIFIFLFAIGLLHRKNIVNPALGFCLLGIWCVAVVGTATAGIHTGGRYQTYINESPDYAETSQEFTVSTSTNAVVLSGGQHVRFVQGNEPKIEVTGRAYDLKSLVITEENNTVTIERSRLEKMCFLCGWDSVDVIITLPNIEILEVKNGVQFTAESWVSTKPVSMKFSSGGDGDISMLDALTVHMSLSHGSSVQATVSTTESTIQTIHGARVELAGKSNTTTISAEYGSNVQAQKTAITYAHLTASHGASIRIDEVTTIYAEAESGGDIEYAGNPELTTKGDESGRLRKRENKPEMQIPEPEIEMILE